jgi:hypothetical protein
LSGSPRIRALASYGNMRTTDKKIDNQISGVLTDVCETALKEFTGFQWVTHLVNYSNFPNSLKVICVFDTNDNLNAFKEVNGHNKIGKLIQRKLFEIDAGISSRHISFDTEESCNTDNKGKWADRLAV